MSIPLPREEGSLGFVREKEDPTHPPWLDICQFCRSVVELEGERRKVEGTSMNSRKLVRGTRERKYVDEKESRKNNCLFL